MPVATTLLDIRKRLCRVSGRFDLVTDYEGADYSDNGGNEIINAAQRWLDRELGYSKETAWLYKKIVSGQSLITMTQARYIREVWIADTTDGRSLLERKTERELREEYSDVPLSSIDTEMPEFWTPITSTFAPDNPSKAISGVTLTSTNPVVVLITGHRFAVGDSVYFESVGGTTGLNGNNYTVSAVSANTSITLQSTDSSTFSAWTSGGTCTKIDDDTTDTDFMVFGEAPLTSTIMIMPPSDGTRTIEILADWYTPELTLDTHTSFWCTHPELLVRACQLQLEIDYHRNSEGVNDWVNALRHDLRKIYHDILAENLSGPPSRWVRNG